MTSGIVAVGDHLSDAGRERSGAASVVRFDKSAGVCGRTTSEDDLLMDSFPDPDSLTDQGLKDLVRELTEEARRMSSNRRGLHGKTEELETQEGDLSYRRRVLHGKIDTLRAELVSRMRKRDGGGDDFGDAGSSGVGEPRRPGPRSGAGGIALPAPEVAGDQRREPPPPQLGSG
jgi:anti-sigma-K factor RsiG